MYIYDLVDLALSIHLDCLQVLLNTVVVVYLFFYYKIKIF